MSSVSGSTFQSNPNICPSTSSSTTITTAAAPPAAINTTSITTNTASTITTTSTMITQDATHPRKSRLTVPAGSSDTTLPSAGAASSATAGGSSSVLRNNGHNLSGSGGGGGSSNSNNSSNNNSRHAHYVARLMDVRQMDIQSALDQMKTLLSTRPQVVYKTSYYRKQTKNHWARDDPAFCVLQVLFLMIASIAYSVAFRTQVTGAIVFLLQSVLWNWLIFGVILATLGREIANRHLTVHQSSSHVRQSVEWLYAFDIHCNAFVPIYALLYGVQFFLLPLILGKSLVALLAANTLYAVALAWYWYITHLGYRALPFLSNTEIFLFPIAGIVLVYLLNLIGYPFGFGWNASRLMAQLFFGINTT